MTGKLAKQADGSVSLRLWYPVMLATVCAAKDANPGVDFMPLQVEYKEKYAAFGRFPGGFTRREGKASDYEILTCLRPLFPDDYHAEVFVNVILFSTDGVDMPDALAGLAASAALAVSDIPFNGPISEVRVARVNGEFIINPTFEQLESADIELMVGATLDNIMMVEGEMQEVQEAEMLEAIKVSWRVGMGPRLSGSPRTTARRRAVSLVTWGMIRSIGICLIVGEAGRQLPLVVTNITILRWILLLRRATASVG